MRASFGFGKIFAVQDHICAELFAIVDLNQRREFWHDHSRRNTKQFPLISQRLGVIASRRRDHASFFLIGRKLRERVARASLLKTSGALQVVELAKNLHAGDFA